MEVQEKITKALTRVLKDAHIRLDSDDDGTSGYAISAGFQGMSARERQLLIDRALDEAPIRLTPEERRQVVMIAALTPIEYASVGPRIRVHQVKPMANAFEIALRGNLSDAKYVRHLLKQHEGIVTTDPKPIPGAIGVFTRFRAKGDATNPLTKAKVMQFLRNDPYIEVLANA